MEEVRISEVTAENVEDLCRVCIPPERIADPAFTKGREEKRKWAQEMLRMWGGCAKLAYVGSTPVGLIQYKPVPRERVVYIHCIFVHEKEHWRKGIGKRLLANLIEDMRRPRAWFDGQPALALVTKTFPGELPDQYPARQFFKGKGFQQVGEDPDYLYYPLEEGFVYPPGQEEEACYIPQGEDRGKAVIIYGPSFCPFAYVFLVKAAQVVKEIIPGIPVRWISRSGEPGEVEKRGGFEGCVVNARPIKSFVLDREAFQREVVEAWQMS